MAAFVDAVSFSAVRILAATLGGGGVPPVVPSRLWLVGQLTGLLRGHLGGFDYIGLVNPVCLVLLGRLEGLYLVGLAESMALA